MVAASINERGIPCSAAMKMIIEKPAFFHTSMITIAVMAFLLDVTQRTGSKPIRESAQFTTPNSSR